MMWKQIEGLNYEVSNLGMIRNITTGKVLKPFDRAKYGPQLLRGYLTVHLCDGHGNYKNKTVHSIVAGAFIGPRPNGLVINHKNGIRSDNRLANLEYCSQSENRKEDFRMGRQSLLGDKNNMAVLKSTEVLSIVSKYKTGQYTQRKLASGYGVTLSAINSILTGKTWSHLTGIKYV